MESAASFLSRRPAAGALPAFSLPPPTSDIPRTAADGVSPSLSSVNTGSSQGSQPPSGLAPFYHGHMHGTWPGNYPPYSANPPTQPAPMSVSPYGPRPPVYGQPPNFVFNGQRVSHSPPGSGEALPAPPHDQGHQPFPTPMSGAGGGSSSTFPQPPHNNVLASQTSPQTPGQGNHATNGFVRPPGLNLYPTASSATYQSSFPAHAPLPPAAQQSPTSANSGLRGLGAIQPPAPYRPYAAYAALPNANGVLSNVHHPGGSMSMVGTIGSLPGYHPQHIMYGQSSTTSAAERPFKCDVCIQAFSRNHDLKRHKRIHLSVKPFPCNHCSKSFSRKDALKRHRLVKGCEKKDDDKASPDGLDRDESANGASNTRADF